MSKNRQKSATFQGENQSEERREETPRPKRKSPANKPGPLNRRKRHLQTARGIASSRLQSSSPPLINESSNEGI